jgi:hypothetical protein
MADKKGSALDLMTRANAAVSYMYAWLSASGTPFRVSRDSLLGITKYASLSVGETKIELDANTTIERIDVISTSGTSTFTVGTTSGGTEIMPSTSVTETEPSRNFLDLYNVGAVDLYFKVLTGSVKLKLKILNADI